MGLKFRIALLTAFFLLLLFLKQAHGVHCYNCTSIEFNHTRGLYNADCRDNPGNLKAENVGLSCVKVDGILKTTGQRVVVRIAADTKTMTMYGYHTCKIDPHGTISRAVTPHMLDIQACNECHDLNACNSSNWMKPSGNFYRILIVIFIFCKFFHR